MKRLVLLSLLALTACVPVNQTARPQIAVVNAPTEIRFPGLADAFAVALEKKVGRTFSFSPAATLRFQETHNDMLSDRAPLRTALIARSQGAAYGLMVGLRGVKTARGVVATTDALKVEITLTGQMQAVLVEPADALVLRAFVSPEFAARVTETVPLELPPGVELGSPEARRLIKTRVEEVRRTTALRYSDGLLQQPLSALADEVAAELTQLSQVR
ncbi:hypothetical protein BH24DEI2_BH24DEI2_22310 [soil metagenome]